MKDLYLLGSTGSIGSQTLDIVRANRDKFNIKAMSMGRDLNKSLSLIEEFKPELVCFREKCDVKLSYNPRIVYGDEGLLEVASYKSKYSAFGCMESITSVKGPAAFVERYIFT